MNILPKNDYVKVERFKAASVTDAGLIVPDNAKPLLKRGIVLSVGPGRYDPKTRKYIRTDDVKPGDEIIWVQQGVEKIFDADNNPHIFVEYPYILAVIESPSKD